MIIGDSKHIAFNTKIFGGQIGAAAIANFYNSSTILNRAKIAGTELHIQFLSPGNLNAAVNVLSPSFFQP
jgi:hypothetical protein